MQRNLTGAVRGEAVVLRPVRATPCFTQNGQWHFLRNSIAAGSRTEEVDLNSYPRGLYKITAE